jgi:hypothetical protein
LYGGDALVPLLLLPSPPPPAVAAVIAAMTGIVAGVLVVF